VLNEQATNADLAASARAHLATCAYCQQQLADYERLDLDIRRYLGPSGPPRYRTEELMKDILEGAAEQPAAPSVPPLAPVAPASPQSRGTAVPGTRRVLSGLGALAAVLVIALLAATLFARFAPRHPTPATKGTPIVKGTSTPPLESGLQGQVWDIAMVSASEGWAVGEADHPLANGGVSPQALVRHYQHGAWSSQVLPIGGVLTGISMVSASEGWAVGRGFEVGKPDSVLLLHYDGHTWKQVPGPQRADAEQVQMLSASEGWAVGDGSILHYDGRTWRRQALPTSLGLSAAKTIYVSDISMLSPAEGWAVGTLQVNGNGDTSKANPPSSGVILHYIGGYWTVQKIIQRAGLAGVSMLSAADGWVSGSISEANIPGYTAPLLLHYSGGQWAQAPQPLNLGSYLITGSFGPISMVSSTDGWVTSFDSGLLHSILLHYDGTAWSKVELPNIQNIIEYSLNNLAMLSANEGWAVGVVNVTSSLASPLMLHYLNGVWSVYSK
jgi:hypothetical protein